MSNYFVTVDQLSINFPLKAKKSVIKKIESLDKQLRLSEVLGGNQKAKALNHYSEAISYYDNQIKFMWNTKKKLKDYCCILVQRALKLGRALVLFLGMNLIG